VIDYGKLALERTLITLLRPHRLKSQIVLFTTRPLTFGINFPTHYANAIKLKSLTRTGVFITLVPTSNGASAPPSQFPSIKGVICFPIRVYLTR